MSAPEGFVALILTHGRPDRVVTYKSLRASGYTGPIRLIVDSLDESGKEYVERYGDEVVIFDKAEAAKLVDIADNNPNDLRGVVYARNASFEIAKKLGFKFFIQLDDDYTNWSWRFDKTLSYKPKTTRSLDALFGCLAAFVESSGIHSLAISQGGDFVGGSEGSGGEMIRASRKVMNTFVCCVDRPFRFLGRVNEDVNLYTHLGSKGWLFLTTNQVSVQQTQTQQNAGGMTILYLDYGTYLKSFYSVMMQPSSVCVRYSKAMGGRLHHSIAWRNTVPKIVSETLRKVSVLDLPRDITEPTKVPSRNHGKAAKRGTTNKADR